MKRIIIILLLGIGGLFSGCDSWLDVQPYDSMTDEQLYSTEVGIQRALNGIYLGLVSNELYAKNLSCGAVDVLGGLYYIPENHTFRDLSQFKYSEAVPKATLESIWKSAYKLISGCNEFLESVSAHRNLLKADEYPVFMGEALAVRTFLHFDLFRLFGNVYTEETKTSPAIPYYDKVTDIAAEILSAEVLMKYLLADVDSAIVCLRHDPILTDGTGTGEGFWDYRSYRLNYYAAWALKARMLYYMGTAYEAEAGRIARALLDSKDPLTGEADNFMEVFPGIDYETGRNDRLFYPEMLFGMHNMKRETLYKGAFSLDLENNNLLSASIKYLENLFTDDSDVRRSCWEDVSAERGDIKSFVKFYPTQAYSENPYLYETQVLLRKSELYLIASATATDPEEKAWYLEELRLLRGYQVGNMVGLDPNELLDLEWKKEFYGEGQYFFFLKRNQVQTITDHEGYAKQMSAGYAVPLPESETNNRYDK